VPAVDLAGSVLEVESENGVALLQRILAVGLAGVKCVVDLVESRGGGELVWFCCQQLRPISQCKKCMAQDVAGWVPRKTSDGVLKGTNAPFLRDIVAFGLFVDSTAVGVKWRCAGL
jgi:hypothetical protein